MISKTIFNMDSNLKKAAMKKAKNEGVTLSAVLNMATKSFVEDRLRLQMVNEHLEQGRADAKAGRTVTIEQLIKKYKIK